MVRNRSIPVRVNDAEHKMFSEAANALEESMSEVARAAWSRMVKRADKKGAE